MFGVPNFVGRSLTSTAATILELGVKKQETVPDVVAEAAAKHHRIHPPAVRRPAERVRGEIAVARDVAGTISVMVLVLGRQDCGGRDWSNVIVCDTLYEMASDLDLILDPTETRPYRLVAFSELYSTVWTDQLVDHVDYVSDAEMEAIADVFVTDGASLDGFSTGLPLAGPVDPRWQWRHRMLPEVLEPLRHDVLGVLLDGY